MARYQGGSIYCYSITFNTSVKQKGALEDDPVVESVRVMAPTIEAALAAVRENYPSADIRQVVRQGDSPILWAALNPPPA